MASFKDITKKLKEAGQTAVDSTKKAAQSAVDSTKKAAETANLNSKVNKRQGDLNKALLELGMQFYKSKKNKIPKEFAEQFASVNEIRADIADMKQKIEDLKTDNDVDSSLGSEPVAAPEAKPEPKVEIISTEETPAEKTVTIPKSDTKTNTIPTPSE